MQGDDRPSPHAANPEPAGFPHAITRHARRICVVAETLLDRQAIVALLTERFGLKAVSGVENDARPIWAALRGRPEFMLVSAPLARAPLVDSVQMILRLAHETKVIVLAASADADAWSRLRLDGLVDRDGGVDELRVALDTLSAGKRFASRSMRVVVGAAGLRGRRLTRRESELLPLLARGLTLRDAAAQLSVSYKTADAHRTRLLKKLGVKGRVELARFAIREKIIDP
ncbi:MAG: Transcriptional regulatory protein RcsB [Phycisphaerae bacterium]|nr:Transcriptional regulatory protein RcsB [Phycisphaerae bacterium]